VHRPDPPLTDGELTLRPGRPEDEAEIVPLLRDPEIPRWTRVPPDYQPSDWHDRLAVMAAAPDEHAGFLVVDPVGAILGSVGLHDVAGRSPAIGYWVAAHARGRRIAPRATRLVTAWAHDELGLARIELLAHTDNHASRRAALHAGYVDTGERRENPGVGPPGTYLVFVSER
jgi:RimJ/RimL family protein N-acetyltransferase